MEESEAEAWRLADGIFDTLLELPAGARAARLDELSPEPGVRDKVLALLSAHDNPDSILDKPVLPCGDSPIQCNALAGRTLGRWRLREELGRGGTSVVYLAERASASPAQQVAIKIFSLATLSNSGAERFQREAQILARLSHPSITPLIDSGVEEDGTYWLAMPLVRGSHIDLWCESRQLGTHTIVELFLRICEAVAYAHRSLVIHRDLKPSNVLVEEGGHVRLLDFGIGRFSDDTEARTHILLRAITPGYASPEQIRGDMPSTAMDVYGLGALLYRLLTGTTHGEGAPRPAAIAKNSESHRRHHRALSNDLERVLQKALAQEPERRYQSVEFLQNDLRRWLEGRPVLARPPGFAYHCRKFAARNKSLTALAVLLVIALVVGVSGNLRQMAQLRAERQLTQRELAHATALNDFIIELFSASAPDRAAGATPGIGQLLEHGIERARDREGVGPVQRVDMLLAMGEILLQLGRLEQAEELAWEADGIARSLSPRQPVLLARAIWLQARLARYGSRLERAAAAMGELEALLARHHPNSVLRLRNRLMNAYLLRDRNNYAQSAELLESLSADPGFGDLPRELRVEVTASLAFVYDKLGRHRQARPLYRRLLTARAGSGPGVAKLLALSANNNSKLALFSEAEEQFAEALELFEQSQVGGSQHSAFAWQLYGHHFRRRGRIGDSLSAFARAEEYWQASLEYLDQKTIPFAGYQRLFALEEGMRWRELEQVARKELEYLRAHKADHPLQFMAVESMLARSLCVNGRREEARVLLVGLSDHIAGKDAAASARVLEAEAVCHLAEGRVGAALGALTRAVDMDAKAAPGEMLGPSRRTLLRAQVLEGLGRSREAGRLRARVKSQLDELGYPADGPLRSGGPDVFTIDGDSPTAGASPAVSPLKR